MTTELRRNDKLVRRKLSFDCVDDVEHESSAVLQTTTILVKCQKSIQCRRQVPSRFTLSVRLLVNGDKNWFKI